MVHEDTDVKWSRRFEWWRAWRYRQCIHWMIWYRVSIISLQHSMENFYRELPQLRCTELQLKMRFAGLHLQLKRVAHEQNMRLAVSSRAQRGSVADKRVFCEGALLFEVAAGQPTEFSISSDNLNWGNSRGKICHWVLYGILRLTIVIYKHSLIKNGFLPKF